MKISNMNLVVKKQVAKLKDQKFLLESTRTDKISNMKES